MSRLRTKIGLALVLMLLAACSSQAPTLMNLRAEGEGPDEFGVLPTRPLEMPADLASLPTPTLGGTNRADPDPEADVAAALGGDVNRATPGTAGLMERLAGDNVYYRAYRVMALDRYAELERMRAAGIRTPAAPPQSIGNLN